MIPIKSIDKIAEKWAKVTPMRTQDYADGVNNPQRSWATATANAEPAYEAGVAKSIQKKAFGKGVKKAGDAKWQRKATTNGVNRWGPGVQEAQGDYQAGFAPYREAISKVTLPPRYPRRDPRNLARVEAVVKALAAEKERQLSAA